MKTITEITLYDLMAEDLDVWISRNASFGYNLEIDNDNGKSVIDEKGIHPCATDSLADFCRRFLSSYDKASNREGL